MGTGFYINLPFGAVTIGTILLFFKPPHRPSVSHLPIMERIGKVDLLGLFFFMPSIICLLLALQWGGSKYPWNNGRIIALFVVFGVVGLVFIGVQYSKGDNATVPPRIISQRSIIAATWYAFCNGAAFLTMVYYVPLWHQVIRDQSAVESGIRLLPMILGLVITTMLSGAMVALTGYCKFDPSHIGLVFEY